MCNRAPNIKGISNSGVLPRHGKDDSRASVLIIVDDDGTEMGIGFALVWSRKMDHLVQCHDHLWRELCPEWEEDRKYLVHEACWLKLEWSEYAKMWYFVRV